jgi:anti-sigma factor RsiW
MAARDDIELMQHADGELPDDKLVAGIEARLESDPEARAKSQALGQVGEVVRGHLELAADDVPARRFDQMWRNVSREIARSAPAPSEGAHPGVWAKISGWFERHRGHVFTGIVSAGAVAALALVLRPGAHDDTRALPGAVIDVRPAAFREAPEIDSLDTPDGTGTVLNLEDEDGHTAVIWVTPADTVEGI